MAERNPYHSLPQLVMRSPRYPLGVLLKALESQERFMNVVSTDEFKNAILFASPALYEELKNLVSGNITNPKNQAKVRLSLLKYLSRMSSRCTPFASLAACSCVSWSNESYFDIHQVWRENFRLDMIYTCVIIEKLLREHGIREQLKFRINSSVYSTGKYLRYITHISRGMGQSFQIQEIKCSVPLRLLVRKAVRFETFVDLRNLLTEKFGLSVEQATGYLHSLIDIQILESELNPFVTGDDLLEHLSIKLETVNETWHHLVKELSGCLSKLSTSLPVESNERLHLQIRNLLEEKSIKVNPKFLIQLDSFVSASNGTLSRRVMRTVRQGLDLLCRIIPVTNNGHLQQFKQRFTARYQDEEIPLLEALDPDIGIGYVLTQDRVSNPLVDGLRLPVKSSGSSASNLSAFHHILMRKISELNWEKSHCVEITDDNISKLSPHYLDLPTSMAAMFELTELEDNGSHILSDLHFTGTTAANLLGRFAYGDNGIREIVNDVARHEKQCHDDVIVAEIAHIPQTRTGNILFRPHIYDYEIGYLSNTLITDENYIPANDLYISIKGNRIVLRSARLGKEILPRLTTAHNYSGTDPSPVYRFLCDMQHQTGRASLSFSWGVMANMAHLPRVQYQNIILSKERWLIQKENLPLKKMKTDFSEWLEWKKGMRLPRFVTLTAGDNKLLVDTDNRFSVEAMLSEVGNSRRFTLEEFLPSRLIDDDWSHHYMKECVVPLIKNKRDEAS